MSKNYEHALLATTTTALLLGSVACTAKDGDKASTQPVYRQFLGETGTMADLQRLYPASGLGFVTQRYDGASLWLQLENGDPSTPDVPRHMSLRVFCEEGQVVAVRSDISPEVSDAAAYTAGHMACQDGRITVEDKVFGSSDINARW